MLLSGAAHAQWSETWDNFPVDTDVSGGAWGDGTVNGAITRDEVLISANHSISGAHGGGNAARSSMFRPVVNAATPQFIWHSTDHSTTFFSSMDVAMTSGQNWDATWGTLTGNWVGFAGENRGDGQVFVSSGDGASIDTWNISPGNWYDMKIELLAGDQAMWSYKEHTSNIWVNNPGGPVATPPGFLFNYVGISSYQEGGGVVYVDDVVTSRLPSGLDVVPSANVVIGNTLTATFATESNMTYRLQSSTNLAMSKFTDTGAMAIGNGGPMILFDTPDSSGARCYRVMTDLASTNGADDRQVFEAFATLGGIASSWADFNNDGFVDVICGGWLWENAGGTNFTRHTTYNFSGFGTWGDFNNDGFVDYYGMSHDLWRNDGGTGSFTPIPLPLDPSSDHLGGTWFDIENDGDLDLYVGGFENPYYQVDFVLRNNGNETFSHIWTQPGDSTLGAGDPRPGRGVTHLDYNGDGFQDIYVSYYRLEPNGLWENDGSGNFTDIAGSVGATAANGHSIGSSVGDIDNDGHMDIFGANFSHEGNPLSRFLRNTGSAGNHVFQDVGQGGVGWVESYASSSLADYDNDGDLDLFFTAVYGGDSARLYENRGNWTFKDVTFFAGLSGILGTGSAPYDASWADFDNDGDLDLITNGGVLYRNKGNDNNWLKLKIAGDASQGINAMGAEIRLSLPDRTLTRQVEGNTGQGNQNEVTALHFGLGGHSASVQMEVRWGGGVTRSLTVLPNQVVDVAPLAGPP